MRASAAVTVVLPTPPFPATMSTRVAEQNWETSIPRRRLVSTLLLLFTAALAALGAAPTPASGAPTSSRPPSEAIVIDVIEVSGLLDPINVDFMSHALHEAASDRVAALLIRLDSRGSVAPTGELRRLIQEIDARRRARRHLGRSRQGGPRHRCGLRRLRRRRREGGGPSVDRSGATRPKPPSKRARPPSRPPRSATSSSSSVPGIAVPTKVVERDGRPPQQELAPGAHVRFDEPSLLAQLLHTVATPSAAYLLFVIGLLLILFEFFTAGIGVAGATGAAAVVLGGYGLGVLPAAADRSGGPRARDHRLRGRRPGRRAPRVDRHRHYCLRGREPHSSSATASRCP